MFELSFHWNFRFIVSREMLSHLKTRNINKNDKSLNATINQVHLIYSKREQCILDISRHLSQWFSHQWGSRWGKGVLGCLDLSRKTTRLCLNKIFGFIFFKNDIEYIFSIFSFLQAKQNLFIQFALIE